MVLPIEIEKNLLTFFHQIKYFWGTPIFVPFLIGLKSYVPTTCSTILPNFVKFGPTDP